VVLGFGEGYGGGSGLKMGGPERLWGFFKVSPTRSACIRLRPVRRCGFRMAIEMACWAGSSLQATSCLEGSRSRVRRCPTLGLP